jgi:hypothetical protein
MLKSRGKKVKELDIALKKKQFAVAQSAHDLTASLQVPAWIPRVVCSLASEFCAHNLNITDR